MKKSLLKFPLKFPTYMRMEDGSEYGIGFIISTPDDLPKINHLFEKTCRAFKNTIRLLTEGKKP